MVLKAASQGIRLRAAAIGLLAAALHYAPMADAGGTSGGWLPEQLSVAAFGTLGLAYNDSPDVEFVRNLSQPDGARGGFSALPDTILGAQVNYRPAPRWELVLQAISKHDYREEATPTISWAYIGYAPGPRSSLRLGRIGVDSYLDSDTRNVGFTYLPARRPLEHYGLLELTWIEGADFTINTEAGGGILTAKAYAGMAGEKIVDREQQRYSLKDSRVVGGYLQQQWGELRLRTGVSAIRLQRESAILEPLLADLSGLNRPAADRLANDLALEDSWIRNWSTSLAWTQGPLQIDRVDAPIPEGALLRQSRPGWNGDATVISLTLDFVL